MKMTGNVTPIVRAPATNELVDQVAIVMEQYPELAAYGFHFSAPDWKDVAQYQAQRAEMLTAAFCDQVATCLDALTQPRTRRNAWRVEQHSSYVLKHMVERWAQAGGRADAVRYVSNGAFIVAAVIDGWSPVRIERSPNCRFKRGAA